MNKLFKRLIITTAVFMSSITVAFAEFKTDLQTRFGWSTNFYDVIWTNSDYWGVEDDVFYDFSFSLANYNLFKLNNFFSVGFMETFSIDTNDDVVFSFLFGPAVALQIKDIVSFRLGTGLDYMNCNLKYDTTKDYSIKIKTDGWGYGYDLQAKFFPDFPFSVIVGNRYTIIVPSDGKVKVNDTDYKKSDLTSTIFSFKYYVGFSFNLSF